MLIRQAPRRVFGAGLLRKLAGVVELLERVCVDVVQALSASGAGVSVMAGGVHCMAAASDPRTARIEELQFTLGEGSRPAWAS